MLTVEMQRGLPQTFTAVCHLHLTTLYFYLRHCSKILHHLLLLVICVNPQTANLPRWADWRNDHSQGQLWDPHLAASWASSSRSLRRETGGTFFFASSLFLKTFSPRFWYENNIPPSAFTKGSQTINIKLPQRHSAHT